MRKNLISSFFWATVCSVGFFYAFSASAKIPKSTLLFKNDSDRLMLKYSRHDDVFQREDFHASVVWHATYFHPDFFKSYSEQKNQILGMDTQEAQNSRNADVQKFGPYTVFHVSFYAYDTRFADLVANSEFWTLRLKAQEQILKPLRIEKIQKADPLHRQIFPYSDVWSQQYFVFFPKIENEDIPVQLTLHGPQAQSELVWE